MSRFAGCMTLCTHIVFYNQKQQREGNNIGVGDGGTVAPQKNFRKNIFRAKIVKFGHFVNLSCIYFLAQMSYPRKVA